MLLVKMFLGLVEMAFGLVYASFSLPERQALKMTFFAPCATDGSKLLIKPIYGTAPKSLFWAPAVYQDLSLHHDWPVNPFSPNSDQHQFSPNDIPTLSRD